MCSTDKTNQTVFIYELQYSDGTPFYVGQTKDIEKRLYSHKHNQSNEKLKDIISSLSNEGKEIRCKVITQTTKGKANKLEMKQIESRIKEGFKIANIVIGDMAGGSNFGMRKWSTFDEQKQILMDYYKQDNFSATLKLMFNEKLMQIENSKQIGG